MCTSARQERQSVEKTGFCCIHSYHLEVSMYFCSGSICNVSLFCCSSSISAMYYTMCLRFGTIGICLSGSFVCTVQQCEFCSMFIVWQSTCRSAGPAAHLAPSTWCDTQFLPVSQIGFWCADHWDLPLSDLCVHGSYLVGAQLASNVFQYTFLTCQHLDADYWHLPLSDLCVHGSYLIWRPDRQQPGPGTAACC